MTNNIEKIYYERQQSLNELKQYNKKIYDNNCYILLRKLTNHILQPSVASILSMTTPPKVVELNYNTIINNSELKINLNHTNYITINNEHIINFNCMDYITKELNKYGEKIKFQKNTILSKLLFSNSTILLPNKLYTTFGRV